MLGNKSQWSFNKNTNIFFHEIAFHDVNILYHFIQASMG